MDQFQEHRLPWILNPTNLFGLALLSVLLGVGGSGVYDFLVSWLQRDTDASWIALGIGVGFSLVAVLVIAGLLGLWTLVVRIAESAGLATVPAVSLSPFPGLIAFVSAGKGTTTAYKAVEWQLDTTKVDHREIRFCWLIHTPASESNANQIVDAYTDRGITFKLVPVADQNNATTIYKAMETSLNEAKSARRLFGHEVLVDITGGTKISTFAMTIAAQRQGAPAHYIQSEYNADKGGQDFDTATPLLFDYNFMSTRHVMRIARHQVSLGLRTWWSRISSRIWMPSRRHS